MNSSGTLKIMYFNVRSLLPKLDELMVVVNGHLYWPLLSLKVLFLLLFLLILDTSFSR